MAVPFAVYLLAPPAPEEPKALDLEHLLAIAPLALGLGPQVVLKAFENGMNLARNMCVSAFTRVTFCVSFFLKFNLIVETGAF